MANVYRTQGRTFDLSTKADEGTNNYIIGDPSDGEVGLFAVHIRNVATLSASIVVKARSRIPQAADDNATFQPIPYKKKYLNGAVADNTYVSVPITGESIIEIPASGLQISLDVTYTSGQGRIYWCPCTGDAG